MTPILVKILTIPEFETIMKTKAGLLTSFEKCIKEMRRQTRFSYIDIIEESKKNKGETKIILVTINNIVIFTSRIIKTGIEAEISMVYTNPKFRGQGYCKSSLKTLIKSSKAKNFWLDVKKNNIPAISCYEKVGFLPGKITGSSLRMSFKKSSCTRKNTPHPRKKVSHTRKNQRYDT